MPQRALPSKPADDLGAIVEAPMANGARVRKPQRSNECSIIAPRRNCSAHLHRPWRATYARARYDDREARNRPILCADASRPNFGKCVLCLLTIVIGSDVVEGYLADHVGHRGIKAARSQYEAWLDIVAGANRRNPEDVKAAYPKASIPNDAEAV